MLAIVTSAAKRAARVFPGIEPGDLIGAAWVAYRRAKGRADPMRGATHGLRYVRRAAYYAAITEGRRLLGNPSMTQHVQQGGLLLHTPDDNPTPSPKLEHAERMRAFVEATCNAPRSLSLQEKCVLYLIAVEELPISEVATELDIRPNTASVHLHRARRKVGEGKLA